MNTFTHFISNPKYKFYISKLFIFPHIFYPSNRKMHIDSDISSDEEVFIKYKTRRFDELKKGILTEFNDESELVRKSKTNTMIVHFYKPEFRRCEIMNHNLDKVSILFPGVEFYKILAEKCTVVTERLNITTLPFLAFFKNGFYVDAIVGFEGITEDDSFSSDDLAVAIRRSELFKC